MLLAATDELQAEWIEALKRASVEYLRCVIMTVSLWLPSFPHPFPRQPTLFPTAHRNQPCQTAGPDSLLAFVQENCNVRLVGCFEDFQQNSHWFVTDLFIFPLFFWTTSLSVSSHACSHRRAPCSAELKFWKEAFAATGAEPPVYSLEAYEKEREAAQQKVAQQKVPPLATKPASIVRKLSSKFLVSDNEPKGSSPSKAAAAGALPLASVLPGL